MRFRNVLCGTAAALMLTASMPVTAVAESVQAATVEKEYGASITQGDLRFAEKSDGTLEVDLIDENIKSAVIPETVNGKKVTSIGNNAFHSCDSLTSVTIPNSVTAIDGYAFYGCYSLTSVTIPNSVTSIGRSAFGCCSGLTSVTIPNSVTSIGDGMFAKCYGLTSVIIPNSVKSIGKEVFSQCRNMTSVTIPSGVTSINAGEFFTCLKLKDIYYGGTEAQWKKLIANSGWDGRVQYLENGAYKYLTPTVHYNSSIPDSGTNPGGSSGNKSSDINGDGKTDLTDIMALLKKYVAGTSDSTMDYNGDGKVNLSDVTGLLNDYVNGRI